MSIKDIINDFEDKLRIKEEEEAKKYNRENQILQKAHGYLQDIILPAFDELKLEIMEYGKGRNVVIKKEILDIELSIIYQDVEEFTYKISLEIDNANITAFVATHHIGKKYIVVHGVKEKLLDGITLEFLKKENVINDFYAKYRNFMMTRLEN